MKPGCRLAVTEAQAAEALGWLEVQAQVRERVLHKERSHACGVGIGGVEAPTLVHAQTALGSSATEAVSSTRLCE
jgi:hypothetical protein